MPTINYAQRYSDIVDEVFRLGALTNSIVNQQYSWVDVDTVKVYSIPTVSMTDYTLTGSARYGVASELQNVIQTMTLQQDRSFTFTVDRKSVDDTMGVMAAAAALRRQIEVDAIPEIDAYTFATLASKAGISTVAGATITPGTTDVPNLIDAAEAQMDNDEVPYEGRILFVSPACYMGLKEKIERRIINSENNVNTNVEFYDDMRIIRVPTSRFNTSVTLSSSDDSHDDAGGFTLSGNAINFMIVHPSAVIKVMKHRLVRVFTPAQNPTADGYLVNYRYCAGVFVPDNKVKGIYLHKGTTVSG